MFGKAQNVMKQVKIGWYDMFKSAFIQTANHSPATDQLRLLKDDTSLLWDSLS